MYSNGRTNPSHRYLMVLYILMVYYYLEPIDCACTEGPNNVAAYIITLPGTSGEQVILTDNPIVVGCCGLLQSIQFYPRDTGYVQFQVWRPVTINEYMLISEYRYYVPTKDTTITLTLPTDMYVETGDSIGWYTESTGVIPYKTGTYDNHIVVSIGDVTVGYNYSLSTPVVHNRVYAIKFTVGDGNTPDFTNLPASIDVYDDTPIGVTLYTSSFTDADVEDIPSLYLTLIGASASTANVAFDTTTGEFTTTGSLSFGTITVRVRVYDRCSNTKTGDLTINVLNYPPVIGNLPSSCDISEVVTLETFLYEVTVSDASGDLVTCALNDTSPSGAPFLLKYISGTSSYGIYSQSSPSLDFSTDPLYILTIHCSDGMTTDAETFTVHVTENSPAIFSNLPANVSLPLTTPIGTVVYTVIATDPEGSSVSYASYGCANVSLPLTTPIGTVVYTVIATDPEGSSVSYASYGCGHSNVSLPLTTPIGTVVYTVIATDPEGSSVSYASYGCGHCWFKVASSGEVIVDTSLLTKTVATYNVNIRVHDGTIDSSSYTLTFLCTGINSQPTLDNLPRTLNIPESLAIGAEVFTLVMTDPDVTDVHSYVFSYSPASAASTFTFDASTRRLTVASILNYESGVTQYTISFTVDDGHLWDGPKDLIINILDVNDPPVFQKSIYTVTDYERNINHVLPNPNFVLTDDDPGDTVAYTITSGNSLGRFKMDPVTGLLTFMVNYDIDDNNMPAIVDLTVTATDSGGLTASVLLQVTVVDNNENSPVWEQDSYEVTIAADITIGSSVLQVKATDIDVEYTNNNIVYTLYSGSTEYFGIKDSGEMYLLKSVYIYGNYTELNVVIRATSPGRTADVPVKVLVQPATSDDFFDDTGNVAWFSVCIVIGVAAVVVFSVMLYRYFRYGKVCSRNTTETSIEHLNMDSTGSGKDVVSDGDTITTTNDRAISPSNSTDRSQHTLRNGTPTSEPPRYNSPAMRQGLSLATEVKIT